MKKINILGTDYTIKKRTRDEDKELSQNADGYVNLLDKSIVILDSKKDPQWKDCSKEVRDNLEKVVIRHELIHAFLYESGVYESSCGAVAWATNEEMVDWFAIQSPKIFEAYEKLGVL